MRFKMLTAAVFSLAMLSTGCSTIEKVVYRPDINQGNYLTPEEVQQLQKGMTKQQVQFILGSPMLQDPFSPNTWIYVFRQQPGHAAITQQTLTLTFDSQHILVDIQNVESIGPKK